MSVEVIERPKTIIEWEVYCQECDFIVATADDYTTAHDIRFAHEQQWHFKRASVGLVEGTQGGT